MASDTRNEAEIFQDLTNLCLSPGYVHAIAFFCFRDNTIGYSDKVTAEDVLGRYGTDKLVRTEVSTLIGLCSKAALDTTLPSPETMQSYIDQTEHLLQEIHRSMLPPPAEFFDFDPNSTLELPELKSAQMIRESIFYGAESAYHFQYRDFLPLKYQKDDEWLKNNKGYSIEHAVSITSAIASVQVEKINSTLLSMKEKHPKDWSFLEAFKFSAEEITNVSGIEAGIVKNFISSLVSSIEMDVFNSLDDFNPKNAYPIIQIDDDEYLLFQNYSLVEALYETPFFWFQEDRTYRNQAMENRGEFTEKFAAERLKAVFGESRVFQNINVVDESNSIAGEIDVLVVFANRAIIVQAKSKKLTIASRKGNDLSLRDDFKKAVQDAYDQAFSCATMLQKDSYRLVDKDKREISILRNFKEIYPFCVVSDHYPSLSFQARQFLEFDTTDIIQPPFVMDVFFLDVLAEMLGSPLYFLSYINRRTGYAEKILATHELTILSYHLKQNLFMDGDYSMVYFEEDICADLDLAMITRRDSVPGVATPEGILTKYSGTTLGGLISQIESQEDPGTIDLGFMLLLLGEDTIDQLNIGIDSIAERSQKDGNCHDVSIAVGKGETGLTVHSNYDGLDVAGPRLQKHVEYRKYSSKVNSWFGICVDPDAKKLKFGIELVHEWEQSDRLDKIVSELPKPQTRINVGTVVKGRKIGRNEQCPCGSGIKYKRCCGKG